VAQENQISAEEQLKAFQTSYREVLSSRYGLDPAVAEAIPSGTASEMEAQAKFLQQAISASGKPGEHSSRSLPSVDALLAQKYKGPTSKAEAKGASK